MQGSTLTINVNVFQRLLPEEGGTWSCRNCDLHRHPVWFASRMVVGSVTHTACRPLCLGEAEQVQVPTFAELDAHLNNANDTGTHVDVVGSRYRLSDESDAVCETTEVVKIRAGESYLFSPAWLHRTIPATAEAAHVGVSMQVALGGDIDFDRPADGVKRVCSFFAYTAIAISLMPSIIHIQEARDEIALSTPVPPARPMLSMCCSVAGHTDQDVQLL